MSNLYAQTEKAKWKRFPPNRQREFPFVHEPGYYRKAKPFIEKEILEENWDVNFNLYHVTTNLSGVIASERLKSRNELKGTVGLGGGSDNEAPFSISTTYDIGRAKKIYDDMKFVCSIVRGQVPAHIVYDSIVSDSFGLDESDKLKNVLRNNLPRDIFRKIWNGELPEEEMDKHITEGEALYNFMQDLEGAATDNDMEMAENANDVRSSVLSVTGFTASYENMLKINSNEIAILQLVAKKDAKPEHVIGEMELRFRPEDIKVVRVLQP